jgi:hypothetical protein
LRDEADDDVKQDVVPHGNGPQMPLATNDKAEAFRKLLRTKALITPIF